ncbi:GMC family oxidoreductase [Psychrosphaera sp. 1_MG-2023]|uniref:GMC oxidoreductase n=1 Tax=Psychrosphaera sp. 1_MG-2023 TaxID=3062643 RepID=UPI0026E46370|nr:GMC family oxidoreductase [Psychrosphaera sp. 1_MG-2023]MDO6720371.1 GMC family oxidoreductase [Psychrosphaera sp. 1_MG-2023]
MLINARTLTSPTKIDADICILGAGAAGITLANELNQHFDKIVLLEAGGENYEESIQELYDAHTVSKYYPDPKESRLRYLGGATNHWANNTSPFSPIDFEKRSWVSNSGWPFGYDAIQPFYLKAAKYCQTGEDGYEANHWLSKLKKDNLLNSATNCELAIAKASVPPTRFYQTHGQALVDSKNVIVYKYANVSDMNFETESKDVKSITFSAYNGIDHTVHATKFIMCFGGLENARMLLHFNSKYKNKLGNSKDNVGRYFMDHPTLNAAQIFSDRDELNSMSAMDRQRYIVSFFQLKESTLIENETINLRMPVVAANEYQMSDGISSFHILKQAFKNFALPDDFGTHVGNFITDVDMVIEAVARKQFDSSVFDGANENVGFQIPMMVEQTPHRNNRITLAKRKDRMGIPKLNVHWELQQNDIDSMWKSLALFGQDLGATSLGRIKLLKERSTRLFGDQLGFGHHHMGTTRMSDSEETGVVDPNQLVFGTNNFYIAGCSVFPTGSHVPPTLTIVATTIRLAEYLKRQTS